MTKQNITFSLKDITVTVDRPEGMSDKDFLKVAEKSLLEKLHEGFSGYSYSISDSDSLSFDNIHIGLVVYDDKYGYGTIVKINKKTINVSFQRGVLSGHPTSFKKADSYVDSDVVWGRVEGMRDLGWFEGNTGYLVNGKSIVAIAIGSVGKVNTKAYVIGNTTGYNLSSVQLSRLLFDSKEEAELLLSEVKG